MKKKFVIECEIPKGVSDREFKDYVKEAVEIYSGCFHPEDSLMGWFTNHPVKVRSLLHSRKKEIEIPCPVCKGSGEIEPSRKCHYCDGRKVITGELAIEYLCRSVRCCQCGRTVVINRKKYHCQACFDSLTKGASS